jgi:hypothetical protein
MILLQTNHSANLIHNAQGRPRRILAGNIITARIVSNTPSTTIPSKRKGKQINQIIGYNSKAIKATGQQMMNKSSQNKKVITILLPDQSIQSIQTIQTTLFGQ